jgi:hypothetical protein
MIMRVFNRLPLVLLIFVASNNIWSQQGEATTLTGTIQADFGAGINDVRVIATDKNDEKFFASTDFNGRYRLILPPGIYAMRFVVNLPFKNFEINDYVIPKMSRMRLDVSLICEDCPYVEVSRKNTSVPPRRSKKTQSTKPK